MKLVVWVFLEGVKAKLPYLHFEYVTTTNEQLYVTNLQKAQLRLIPSINVFVRQCSSTTK
jgi:hypothetical protein